jgi:hypothetical protein
MSGVMHAINPPNVSIRQHTSAYVSIRQHVRGKQRQTSCRGIKKFTNIYFTILSRAQPGRENTYVLFNLEGPLIQYLLRSAHLSVPVDDAERS